MSTKLNGNINLDLLHYINEIPFNFRGKLNLSSDMSFGTEIETMGLDVVEMYNVVKEFNTVQHLTKEDRYLITEDISVDAEVITPVMYDSRNHWFLFSKMYDKLNSTKCYVNDLASSHVHVGTHVINSNSDLSLLLKTLVVFEPILFYFGYGYGKTPRANITSAPGCFNYASMSTPRRYSKFIDALDNDYDDLYMYYLKFLAKDLNIKDNINFNSFNFYEIGDKFNAPDSNDHIEIRCFNGTLDKTISQNNINLITSIINAVYVGRIDKEFIEQQYQLYKLKRYNFDRPFSSFDQNEADDYNRILYSFSNTNFELATRLADMIFVDDTDKLYFMKQYLKLFSRDDKFIYKLKKKL